MISYWILFSIPAFFAFLGRKRDALPGSKVYPLSIDPLWFIVWISLTIFIGFRHKTGGDWSQYIDIFEVAKLSSFADLLRLGDPGYQFLNWLAIQFGFEIYAVNLAMASMFSAGLVFFCRSLPRPFLALAISIPYLVIVVSMGYARQGTALGMALIGLTFLGRENRILFIFWIIAASTLHFSAVILMPIAFLTSAKNRLWSILWIVILSAMFGYIFVASQVADLYTNYVATSTYENVSQGALVRILMCVVPAFIFLIFNSRFNFSESERSLWISFSWISIGLLLLLWVSDASTAIDRIALYMLPLQLVVFSHFPDIFGSKFGLNFWLKFFVILYYLLVQFVWLNYATHASGWLPYQNIIFL
jgi:hypothetical protein